VAKAAPEARIVVTGYPHIFGPAPGIIDAVNKSTDALNATIEQAVTVAQAADVNIRYVDVTEGFERHGIFSDVAFINAPGTHAAFTRMPPATTSASMPSPPHCQRDGQTNKSSWSEVLQRMI
jgi:hypothetical protein